jgi:cobalt-zinc-cadmium efflux system outer membrane protein
MFVRIVAFAALAASALPAAVLAQPGNALGLPEILRMVEASNPELSTVAQQRAGAQAETITARAYPNPELEIGRGPWRSRVGAAPGSGSSVAVSQAIELPAVREARSQVSLAGLSSAEAQVSGVRLAVGYQARTAYYELLRRQEEERLAQETVKLLSEIQDKVRVRVSVGEAPRFELVRSEAETLAAQNLAASARLRVEEARGVLRRLSGNALPPLFHASGALPVLPEVPPMAVLSPQVLEAHPSLRVLGSERERARSRLDLERAQRYPQPTLKLGESRDPETRQVLLGVSIPLPLWNRREGPIAQAQAGIDLAAAQIEAQRAQLLRELDAAYARVSISQRQIETFEAGLLRSAETALRVAEAAWRAGERSFLEVLDAQRTLRAVRSDYTQVRFDRNAAWLDIQRLLARDPFAAGS